MPVSGGWWIRLTQLRARRAAPGLHRDLAGELFRESSRDLARLSAAYDNLKTLARPPAESITFIKEPSRSFG
ncbi:hypothetical protein [Micromonospora sp. DT231]|uniref:hypothetical protein n=1 Tax=Micromonospora sp. DT231 TaxID=3416526 RepID=UPI003CEFBB51